MEKTKKVDIEKMAEEIGVSVKKIKAALTDVTFRGSEEIAKISSIEDAKELYEYYYNSDHRYLKDKALDKMLSLITTKKEAKKIFNESDASFKSETKVFDKLLSFVTNIEEAKEICTGLDFDYDIDFKALDKWLSFVKTIEEAKEVYDYSLLKDIYGHVWPYPVNKNNALRKIAELLYTC